jgi:hypothetical protein
MSFGPKALGESFKIHWAFCHDGSTNEYINEDCRIAPLVQPWQMDTDISAFGRIWPIPLSALRLCSLFAM